MVEPVPKANQLWSGRRVAFKSLTLLAAHSNIFVVSHKAQALQPAGSSGPSAIAKSRKRNG